MSESSKNKELKNILKKEKEHAKNLEGFFATVAKYHWQSILFLFFIFGFIIVLREANKRLNFPESRQILNWFGFIVLANLVITYLIMIIYRQVKAQQGIIGPSGYQGPSGDQGYTQNCGICDREIETMELPFQEPIIRQPILPEKVDLKPRGDLIPPSELPKIKFETGKLPDNDTVYMWEHASYRGNRHVFKKGNYAWTGRPANDEISSLIVPDGYWATLYQHAHFRGRRQTYMPGEHAYVGNYINDRTSAVKVFKEPTRYAVLFEHYDWKGVMYWASGKHPNLGWMNGRISGIYVPKGHQLTVYSSGNFKGWKKTFQSGYYPRMGNYRWEDNNNQNLNDKIHSCILEKKNEN